MITTPQNNPEQNFLKKWSLICVVGYAIGAAVGVIVGLGIVYYLGDNLEIRHITSDSFSKFVMGVVTGGIISFFQWIVLRDYLSNAKWWISAGILSSSVSALIYYFVMPSMDIFNSFLSWVVVVTLIGFFIGYIEWFVLRKDYPNSKGWIGVRVFAYIIESTISILSLDIRAKVDLAIWSALLVILLACLFQGYIFSYITGRSLYGIFESKNEVLAT
jgi:hypothetical protein